MFSKLSVQWTSNVCVIVVASLVCFAPGQARAPRDCNCQDSNNEMMGNGLAGDLNNGMDTSK